MKIISLITLILITRALVSLEYKSSQSSEFCIKQALLSYNEEADTNFSRREYAAALQNYQTVIHYIYANKLSDPSNLLQAICGSMFCYDLLDQDLFAKEAFDELVYEVALLNEKVEEIDWFKESLVYPKFRQNPNRYVANIEKIGLPELTAEERCQMQCNGYAVAAAFACGRVPIPSVQFVCMGCIFGLEQVCIRCCKGQGFWENCVKGLRKLFHDPDHPPQP